MEYSHEASLRRLTIEDFTAGTTYGDLRGDAVVDGYTGPFLNELGQRAGVPQNYFAVGLEVYAGEPANAEHPTPPYWSIKTAACEKQRYGATIDDIRKRAEGELVVKLFHVEMEPEGLLPYIKRLSVTIVNRAIAGVKVVCEDGR